MLTLNLWRRPRVAHGTVVLAALSAVALSPGSLRAQSPAAQPFQSRSGPAQAIVDAEVTIEAQQPQAEEEQPAAESGAEDAKSEAPEGEVKEGSGEGAAAQVDGDRLKRPNAPPRAPDPRELEAEAVNGRVRFSFHGQPWPDVLQWLANVSGRSLDWQELPAGYLNLTTQRSYPLAEARNLINGRLQARGFALLSSGEVLSVVKIDALDPSQIPRVTEDELYDRQPNDIVKLTFTLPDRLEPKQAVEDVKQALSKHARALPLTTTRRLLLIDTVANLRMVSALLNEERVEQQGREIPRRFPLKHARAEKVIDTLYVVLGLDPAAQPSQMELQIQQQKMQLLMQMQGNGKDVSKLLNKDGPPVYLAFNRHENSILANAPPAEMKIIERAIGFLDVPSRGSAAAASEDSTRYAKTYELTEIDPRNLVSTLEEIADLNPLTELRADRKAKILFVRGAESDHKKIAELIAQLDESGLTFEVFPLTPALPADAVAGSILALLGQEEDKDDNNRRRYYYFYDEPEEEKESPALRLSADTENNRLLVYGSEEQVVQVRKLLIKMQALAPEQQSRQPMLVTDPLGPEETQRLLEQLRRLWPTVGGDSELLIEEGCVRPSPPPTPAASPEPEASAATPTRFLFAAESEGSAPAVSITVTPDGRLLMAGNDAEAFAQLRRLVESLTPPADLFREFTVRHASAIYVYSKLKLYFKEEIEGEQGERFRDWWGDWRRSKPKDAPLSLSRRRRLQLIYNTQTNSIVAANASPEQLRTIKRLIETWDKPPRDDLISYRRTGLVKVRFSRAKTIATALKEVYRDLLSSRDKEFDTEEEKGSGFVLPRTTTIEFGAEGSAGDFVAAKPMEVGFDGALSIGVDEVANMLVISAEKELYESVEAMIHTLDEEARPKTTVQVIRLGAQARSVKRALAETLGTAWMGGRPEKVEQPQDQTQDAGGENRGRRDRRRRSRSNR